MKRLCALLLTMFLLITSLSACFSSQNGKNLKVGICLPGDSSVDTSYLEESLKNMGYEVAVFNKSSDQESQINLVHKLYEDKYALVIVEPFLSSAAQDILTSEERKDIPVLFINFYGTPPENTENACFLLYDPADIGSTQAKCLTTVPNNGDVNGDGDICYAVLAGDSTREEVRLQTEHLVSGLQNATHLITIHCGNRSQDPKSLCGQLLSTYGRDLEVLICTDSVLSVAAAEAIADAGRIPGQDLYLIGAGESPDLMKLLENDTVCATVAPERSDGKNQIIDIASSILNGDNYQDTYTLNYSVMQS